MSIFSGKCDFCDSVYTIHCDGDSKKLEEFLARTDIFVQGADGRDHKVICTNEKEACKYYPYLTSIAAYNNFEGRNTIVLSSKCFIDSEEREFIGWHIKDAFKYWRKCKRNKIPFDVEDYINSTYFINNKDIDTEVARRIADKGEKAEFDDIHDSLHEYFRRRWFEEMVRVGWDIKHAFNWCFNEFYPSDEVIKERLGEELYVKYFT